MAPQLTVFCSPERYVQGRDATEQLGDEMKKLGIVGPVAIVAGPSAKRILADAWARTLGSSGYEYHVFTFHGECTDSEIDTIAEESKRLGCKVVIGAGGGKVIDTSRAVADLLDAPAINCPTAASSDAPCSALSVVYNENGSVKRYLFFKRHPLLVLVDTSVIARSPKRLLVSGLGDALATWYEARTVQETGCKCNFLGGRPTLAGTALAKLCKDTLLADGPAAVEAMTTKSVTPAFERVVEANTLLSGLGFECGGICVAHAVHNGITMAPGSHDYMHGEKVAFGLCTQLVLEGRPEKEISTVLSFCETVGLPTTLKQIGIDPTDEELIKIISERATAPGETSHNEPFEVNAAMVMDAIMAADRWGYLHKDRRGLL